MDHLCLVACLSFPWLLLLIWWCTFSRKFLRRLSGGKFQRILPAWKCLKILLSYWTNWLMVHKLKSKNDFQSILKACCVASYWEGRQHSAMSLCSNLCVISGSCRSICVSGFLELRADVLGVALFSATCWCLVSAWQVKNQVLPLVGSSIISLVIAHPALPSLLSFPGTSFIWVFKLLGLSSNY